MTKKFDFDNIGKREPYTVPDDFFASLQKEIERKTIAPSKHRMARWSYILSAAASVAAVVAIVLTIGFNHNNYESRQYSMEDVEACFAHLSAADQQYLLETYQEDVFLSD